MIMMMMAVIVLTLVMIIKTLIKRVKKNFAAQTVQDR